MEERRKDNQQFQMELIRRLDAIEYRGETMAADITRLSDRVEHANQNTKAFKLIIDDDIQELKTSIQGDEAKGITGIAAKIQSLARELSEHVAQDKAAYAIMITIMLATLGWTIFK